MLLLISRTCFVTAYLGPPIKYVDNIEGEMGSKIDQNKNLPKSGGPSRGLFKTREKFVDIFYGGSITLRKYRFFAICNFFLRSSLLFKKI